MRERHENTLLNAGENKLEVASALEVIKMELSPELDTLEGQA